MKNIKMSVVNYDLFEQKFEKFVHENPPMEIVSSMRDGDFLIITYRI